MTETTEEVPQEDTTLQPQTAERWGGFVLSPNAAKETRVTDVPARFPGFPWQEGESPWTHRFSNSINDQQDAVADPRVPWPEVVPAEETFLAANILDDGRGAASGMVAFVQRSHPDVETYKRRDGQITGDDATLVVAWSGRYGQPAYFTVHQGPVPREREHSR